MKKLSICLASLLSALPMMAQDEPRPIPAVIPN